MKSFELVGTTTKRGMTQKFKKVVVADSKEQAKEVALSLIGGKQKVKRKDITITTIEEAH